MTSLFLKLVNMSITASWLVAAVILLRLLLKKAPKALHCALWALVAIRLICPLFPDQIPDPVRDHSCLPGARPGKYQRRTFSMTDCLSL